MTGKDLKYMKLPVLAACLLLALSVCSSAAAGEKIGKENGWQFRGWYGAGCFPAVVPDPDVRGRVYLTSDVAGIWRSDTRGDEWYFITQGLGNVIVPVLAIAPSDSDVLYAGTRKGIYRSDNAGESWEYLASTENRILFQRPENYRSIAVDHADPDTVYAGSKSGRVFFTEDGGKSWQDLLPRTFGPEVNRYPFGKRTPITALYLTRDGDFLFAASASGLIKYNFKRAQWERTELGDTSVLDMADLGDGEVIYVTDGKRVAYSHDLGRTWQYTEPVPSSPGEVIRLSVIRTEDGNIKLAAAWRNRWRGDVIISDDNGKTWNKVKKDLVHSEDLNPTRAWTTGMGRPSSVTFDPFDPDTVYFSDWWSVWRSDDNGKKWKEKVKGAPNTVCSDIHITSRGDIYVATMDNGLMKSGDGGESYRAVFPKKGYSKDVNGHVWRVITCSDDPDRVIATSSPWHVNYSQVIVSRDGGKSFLKTRKGLPGRQPRKNTMWGRGYPKALALDPADPDIVYLGIDGEDGGGLFVSHDGGRSWKRSPGQPASKRVYNALAVDPTDPRRIFWGAYGPGGGVYISGDRGRSWKHAFRRVHNILDLAVDPDGRIYIAGSYDDRPAVLVSRDHGKRWSLLKRFPDNTAAEALLIHPEDPRQIGVSTVSWSGDAPGRIYWTRDAGRSWKDITGDLPQGRGAAAMAYDAENSYLYMARYAGSVYRIKLRGKTDKNTKTIGQ